MCLSKRLAFFKLFFDEVLVCYVRVFRLTLKSFGNQTIATGETVGMAIAGAWDKLRGRADRVLAFCGESGRQA